MEIVEVLSWTGHRTVATVVALFKCQRSKRTKDRVGHWGEPFCSPLHTRIRYRREATARYGCRQEREMKGPTCPVAFGITAELWF